MIGIRLASLCAAALLVAATSRAATPLAVGRYDGTYLVDGTTAAATLQIEVERQHGHRLRVSVFAANEPEFMGRGHVSADDATVKLVTHATGHRRLVLTGTVGAATLDGTFKATRPGRPATTGTFSIDL